MTSKADLKRAYDRGFSAGLRAKHRQERKQRLEDWHKANVENSVALPPFISKEQSAGWSRLWLSLPTLLRRAFSLGQSEEE